MALTFEGAVTQLQVMFPAMDTEVIAAVLESNAGHMQRTVGQLLEIDAPADGPTPALTQPSPSPPKHPSPARGSTVTSTVTLGTGATPAPASTGAPRHHGHRGASSRRWRHPLPDDFLVVPGAGRAPVTSTPEDQMSHDMMLAQMMEDELFLDELRRDPAFAAYLEAESEFFGGRGRAGSMDGAGASHRQRRPRPRRSQAQARAAAARGTGAPSGTSWTSKLASMGDEMKRKFNTLAMRFRRRGGEEQGQDPMQYRSLLVENDGEEGADVELVRPADGTVQRRSTGGDTLARASSPPRTQRSAGKKSE